MYRHGRRSWQPWLISLGCDAASMALIDGGAALHRRACRIASQDPTLHHGSLALLYSMQALRCLPALWLCLALMQMSSMHFARHVRQMECYVCTHRCCHLVQGVLQDKACAPWLQLNCCHVLQVVPS